MLPVAMVPSARTRPLVPGVCVCLASPAHSAMSSQQQTHAHSSPVVGVACVLVPTGGKMPNVAVTVVTRGPTAKALWTIAQALG